MRCFKTSLRWLFHLLELIKIKFFENILVFLPTNSGLMFKIVLFSCSVKSIKLHLTVYHFRVKNCKNMLRYTRSKFLAAIISGKRFMRFKMTLYRSGDNWWVYVRLGVWVNECVCVHLYYNLIAFNWLPNYLTNFIFPAFGITSRPIQG